MIKLSDKEKQILLYLITNCEIYQLNENEALKYIKENFSIQISRRSYYNYKNQVYKNHEKNSPYVRLFKNINPEILKTGLVYHLGSKENG